MQLLTDRLAPTFVQEAARALNDTEAKVRKYLQVDVDSGVCATILAVINKPVVRWTHYAKVAKFIGRKHQPLLVEALTKPDYKGPYEGYDNYLINYFKGARNA